MKTQHNRNTIHPPSNKLTRKEKLTRWKITTNISEKRLAEIEKYLKNAERGRLRLEHDGLDVTRQITQEQVNKFLRCRYCVNDPDVLFNFKKTCVGICKKHWIKLADTVIGWDTK